MKIQESAQDYLESILILSKKQDHVRATDICTYFGYARATVSVFIKQLKENEYIQVDERNYITLTHKGLAIAEEMLERHQVMTDIFTEIGVPPEISRKDACRVEHYLSAETYRALKSYFKK